MDLKDLISKKALSEGFQLFGVSDINELEYVEFPSGRGLMRPSEVMEHARSLFVLGMAIHDNGMNTAI